LERIFTTKKTNTLIVIFVSSFIIMTLSQESSLRLIGKLAKKDLAFVVPTFFQIALDSLEEDGSEFHLERK